jgi:hypothetical protein
MTAILGPDGGGGSLEDTITLVLVKKGVIRDVLRDGGVVGTLPVPSSIFSLETKGGPYP